MSGVEDLNADLEWQLNTSLSIGPWPVTINADSTHGQLRDPDSLEDLRDIHNWSPWFTLRFSDGTTRDVVVGRPDDDGGFTLTNADAAAALEAAAADEPGPDGLLPEPKPVADTTTWLHQHGFTTREHSRGGHPQRQSPVRTPGRLAGAIQLRTRHLVAGTLPSRTPAVHELPSPLPGQAHLLA